VASGEPAARPAEWPFPSARSPQGCDSRSVEWRSPLRSGHPR
jgi:hypothetical protein